VVAAIAVDDPQVGPAAVLHDVHGFAHVYDLFTSGRDLRIVGVLETEDVVGDKDIGVDAADGADQADRQELQKSIFSHININLWLVIVIAGGSLDIAALIRRQAVLAVSQYYPEKYRREGNSFLIYKKSGPFFQDGPVNQKIRGAYAVARLFA
jgi:hypothetical protein